MLMKETSLASAGSTFASILFIWSVLRPYFSFDLDRYFTKYIGHLFGLVYPYVRIKIPEFSGEKMKRGEAYAAIEAYLGAKCSKSATNLKAEHADKESTNLTLTMDTNEEVVDEFCGAQFWWLASKSSSSPPPAYLWYRQQEEYRYYQLSFYRQHRDLVVEAYLDHVVKLGREIKLGNRQRKLFTNNPSQNWYGYKSSVWSHVLFEHPATFDTVAMDPRRKKEIMDDLDAFKKGKEYYAKMGKAWKRGYLLYGPPGTGKSTMIAAIANFMDYDIYDLELTSVKSNTDLRKIFIETTNKSVIVIEDIDCSADLTGKRKKGGKKDGEEEDESKPPEMKKEEKEESKVTLSGLLNFIDGLWSACGGERIIIFTTNHLEKLDPALIRRGRMDKHIEMSYCCFEAFRVLARNYLDVEEHELFERVRGLIGEAKMTPADVAENLMRKSTDDDAEVCIGRLITALEGAKEEEKGKEAEAKAIQVKKTEEIIESNEKNEEISEFNNENEEVNLGEDQQV